MHTEMLNTLVKYLQNRGHEVRSGRSNPVTYLLRKLGLKHEDYKALMGLLLSDRPELAVEREGTKIVAVGLREWQPQGEVAPPAETPMVNSDAAWLKTIQALTARQDELERENDELRRQIRETEGDLAAANALLEEDSRPCPLQHSDDEKVKNLLAELNIAQKAADNRAGTIAQLRGRLCEVIKKNGELDKKLAETRALLKAASDALAVMQDRYRTAAELLDELRKQPAIRHILGALAEDRSVTIIPLDQPGETPP